MEWVLGISAEGGHFRGRVSALNGEAVSVPLADLHKRGLPAPAKVSRRRVSMDFSDWKVSNADEYLAEFGIELPDGTAHRHQIFEVTVGGRRFLVPALALMRGIFRPTRHLLGTMFKPQALDQIAHLDYTSGEPVVVMDSPWATEAAARKHSDWHALLGWLFFYRCARTMVGSIHEAALDGRIAMSLPTGIAQVVMRGVDRGLNFFVTDLVVMSVEPATPPDTLAAKKQGPIALHGAFVESKTEARRFTKNDAIPLHGNGTVKLADDEWAAIEPLLWEGRQTKHAFRLPQRELLDGVLGKLASGVPWRRAPYTVGNWSNAHTAYRDWTIRGVFGEVIGILKASRGNQTCKALNKPATNLRCYT